MVVGALDLKTVTLRPDLLWMQQPLDMTLFRITHQELYFTNATAPEKGLRMLIILKRKVMSEMMTTFFPSVLLMLITFATTLYKEQYFEATLSVNLTTMLVMTTIFISKMESLPPTSDIKMIDIWLILCQMVPFAEVILLTAMEYTREDKKMKGKKAKNKGKGKTRNLQTISLTVTPMGENVRMEEIKMGGIGFNFEIPSLKTLGELVLIKVNICLNFEQNFSREEGASFDCDEQLHHLLWSRFRVLLSDLITQIAEPVCILYCSSLLNITFNYSNH